MKTSKKDKVLFAVMLAAAVLLFAVALILKRPPGLFMVAPYFCFQFLFALKPRHYIAFGINSSGIKWHLQKHGQLEVYRFIVLCCYLATMIGGIIWMILG